MKSVLRNRSVLTIAFAFILSIAIFGRENVPVNGQGSGSGSGDGQKLSNVQKVLSGCLQGKVQTEIKLNNVRTRVLTCGDMWWDVNSNPKYEVPKGSGSYASFAGSLWFGGYVNGQLRISAMTYRQNGVDFWPGPVDPATVDVSASTCSAYDKHWRFSRADVDEFVNKYAGATMGWAGYTLDPSYSAPTWIKEYPGSAPSSADINNPIYWYLAPFNDGDGDHLYDWTLGNFPNYNVTGAPVTQGNCKGFLFGDETLFWVFNDVGNNHTESGSAAQIGVEIRAQAFEFATSDALNDMTFYNFEIINRSSNILDSTYFAVWVDADLGFYNDDYVGCDVLRGLGYIYNGDNNDESGNGVIGYGKKLPALGCDFFQGPNADLNDGIDNDRDGCPDCTWELDNNGNQTTVAIPDEVLPEKISMSKFVPYNNDGNAKTGNPTNTGNGLQFYRYMAGIWKDGTPMRYDGGNGTSTSGLPCSYLYPGDSDPYGFGVNGSVQSPNPQATWTENNSTTGNQPADRRFLQSAGKFTLQPGAINVITFGMPFVRTNSDNNFAAIPLLLIADDKAQSLFDNCFKVLDGPDAPDLTIQEMENQLVVYFSNKPSSNNYELDRYAEVDPTIAPLTASPTDSTDKVYRFEGYMVFQLKDESVSASDIYDEDKARLVFQCDKKNGVSTLVNYNTDPTLGNVPQLMTPEGNNDGIINAFTITEDKFAEGNSNLINHKTYYYMAISYAYNNYLTYKQDVAPGIDANGNEVHPPDGDYAGQKKPYLQGRRNVKVYSAIPHNIAPEAGGTIVNAAFGYGPKVKRIEGQGNGGNILELTQGTVDQILASPDHRAKVLEYENNAGPIKVKVIDPLKVVEGDFTVAIKKVIKKADGVTDSLVMGSPGDLDSGKVKPSYKFQVSGTYVNSDGVTESKVWDGDEIIYYGQEFLLTGSDGAPIGISVAVSQVMDPAANMYPQNTAADSTYVKQSVDESELLSSSLTFSSSSTKWLSAVPDIDGGGEYNWIRSGTNSETPGGPHNDAATVQPFGATNEAIYDDPSGYYENCVGGTWAPYRLCAAYHILQNNPEYIYSPAIASTSGALSKVWNRVRNYEVDNRNLASVDIVFTADKSKWTRSVVLEMGYDKTNNVGNQTKFLPRKSQSVDKNGVAAAVGSGTSTIATDANYISETGMGWFPGYAINVETGERLNIAFGENSSDPTNNGADMIWNPTSDLTKFGGMHYIYVFGHNSDGMVSGNYIDVPRYDAGAALFSMLNKNFTASNASSSNSNTTGYGQQGIVEAYRDAMWVNIPLISSGYTSNFAANAQPSIPCDAKVRIRVRKPLRFGYSGSWNPSYSQPLTGTSAVNPGTTFLNSLNAANVTSDTATGSSNNNFPLYTFNTYGLGSTIGDVETAKNALDLINIVPNPYYGHSQYEKTRIDNYIKIVNLPNKCTIRIYSLNGTLIRTIKKNTDSTTDVYWDLKNEKNILITSGLYVVHVDAGDLGEKILKWFCAMRPIDLQSY